MLNRRQAIGVLGSFTVGARFGLSKQLDVGTEAGAQEPSPSLAPGAPTSPERLALVAAIKEKIAGVEARFESRAHTGDWQMPYRLFKPSDARSRLPLVIYLHGSGGQGTDNVKQMSVGNVIGSRLFAIDELQATHPAYVLVPQTDRGWVAYGPPKAGDSVAQVVPGLGDGVRTMFEIVDALRREFPIDERRIYLTGQSMGGAGAWHALVQRPNFFAAGAVLCGSKTPDDVAIAKMTPIWNFHGDADPTVPVEVSRERVAALRRAGGKVTHTEYAGVAHNVWEWAYSEPALPRWLFAHKR